MLFNFLKVFTFFLAIYSVPGFAMFNEHQDQIGTVGSSSQSSSLVRVGVDNKREFDSASSSRSRNHAEDSEPNASGSELSPTRYEALPEEVKARIIYFSGPRGALTWRQVDRASRQLVEAPSAFTSQGLPWIGYLMNVPTLINLFPLHAANIRDLVLNMDDTPGGIGDTVREFLSLSDEQRNVFGQTLVRLQLPLMSDGVWNETEFEKELLIRGIYSPFPFPTSDNFLRGNWNLYRYSLSFAERNSILKLKSFTTSSPEVIKSIPVVLADLRTSMPAFRRIRHGEDDDTRYWFYLTVCINSMLCSYTPEKVSFIKQNSRRLFSYCSDVINVYECIESMSRISMIDMEHVADYCESGGTRSDGYANLVVVYMNYRNSLRTTSRDEFVEIEIE